MPPPNGGATPDAQDGMLDGRDRTLIDPSQPSAPADGVSEGNRPSDEFAGLSLAEAARRLHDNGFNEIPEETISNLRRFLGNFWGPIPWMLEGAALVALLLGAWGTLLIILGNLGLNAIVAFWEELQANRAITALRDQLAPQARVRRDGVWKTIAARELVPGDLIQLRLGNVVPADARMIAGNSLALDRASLTGESLPIECEPGDTLHAGTSISRGEADAIVTATGRNIHFATTIQLVQKTAPVGHLQRIIVAIGRLLLFVALGLDLLILIVAAFRRDDMAATLEYALLLAVAAVPVSMPTVLSVTMAVGAQRLARHGVLVSRLAAVEELAAMDWLCVDKTGTLTQNTLTAGTPFSMPGVAVEQVLLDAALASRDDGHDPIDRAILGAMPDPRARAAYEIIDFTPFDPVRKRANATVRAAGGQTFQVAKGALQVIMELTRPSKRDVKRAQKAVEAFAGRGFRSLAVARTSVNDTSDGSVRWTLEGIIPLYDPLRPDAKEMVAAVGALGARVQLLTGDQHAIGAEITSAVGLKGAILDAQQLTLGSEPPDEAERHLVESAAAFAQVLPEHKYRIVEALQSDRHIVGMTGDGINDTPALRKADVGIAVTGASEAARAASDLVLVRLGLMPLVETIQESRRIFQRMRTYVIYRVTETMRRLFALTVAILLFNFYPVTPAMLALLATFNAIVLIALAYDETQPSPHPEVWRMSEVMSLATALGILGIVEFFGLYFLSVRVLGVPRGELQTVLFIALTAAGYFTLLIARTRGPFWSRRPAPILLAAISGALGLSLLVALLGWFMTPLSWQWMAFTLGYSVGWFFIGDMTKLLVYRVRPATRVMTTVRRISAGREKPSQEVLKAPAEPRSK